MKKEYILFIDSGIGGLSTLAESYKIVPANFIYFADNKNCPYGSHGPREIFEFLSHIIDSVLKRFSVKIVVLACNTATTSAIESLRKTYKNLHFVGTEPALKFACDLGYKKILCLATPTTVKQKKFKKLSKSIQNNCVCISSVAIENLAKNIEDNLTNLSLNSKMTFRKNMFKIMQIAENHDCIVLGCTHYCLVAQTISKMTKKPVISGNLGVAHRVFDMHKYFCINQNENTSSKRRVIFMLSSENNFLKQKYIKIFKQILAKDENVC